MGRDPANLLWVIVKFLFPSVFTIVRVVPAVDRVVVLVTEPAGFVTVCVLVIMPDGVVWTVRVFMPMALPRGIIMAPPRGVAKPPAFRLFAAIGIQTSKPIATNERIRCRIATSFPLTSLGLRELVKEMVASYVPIVAA